MWNISEIRRQIYLNSLHFKFKYIRLGDVSMYVERCPKHFFSYLDLKYSRFTLIFILNLRKSYKNKSTLSTV
jgi:hypothetical protein